MTTGKRENGQDEETAHLLSVGEVCTACGVSRKTLFYYDRIGLLKPARRIGSQNCKYYDTAGVGRLRQILQYRDAGISLRSIARLLDADDAEKLAILSGELRRAEEYYSRGARQREKIRGMILSIRQNGMV